MFFKICLCILVVEFVLAILLPCIIEFIGLKDFLKDDKKDKKEINNEQGINEP